jgi:hypothetical protein
MAGSWTGDYDWVIVSGAPAFRDVAFVGMTRAYSLLAFDREAPSAAISGSCGCVVPHLCFRVYSTVSFAIVCTSWFRDSSSLGLVLGEGRVFELGCRKIAFDIVIRLSGNAAVDARPTSDTYSTTSRSVGHHCLVFLRTQGTCLPLLLI